MILILDLVKTKIYDNLTVNLFHQDYPFTYWIFIRFNVLHFRPHKNKIYNKLWHCKSIIWTHKTWKNIFMGNFDIILKSINVNILEYM